MPSLTPPISKRSASAEFTPKASASALAMHSDNVAGLSPPPAAWSAVLNARDPDCILSWPSAELAALIPGCQAVAECAASIAGEDRTDAKRVEWFKGVSDVELCDDIFLVLLYYKKKKYRYYLKRAIKRQRLCYRHTRRLRLGTF